MQPPTDAALLTAVAHLREGVQVIGRDWTYLYLNDTAARHGQRPRQELLGRTMMACYPGIEASPVFAVLERVMRSRQAETVRNEFTYPNGERAWFDLVVEPVPDGICVLSLDVTDKLRVEAELQQAQKMEAIGQLAGGIAHDFNNALTGILGYCELLLRTPALTDAHRADVDEIRKGAEHAAALTRQLLAFSRRQFVEPRALDLNAVITDTARLLERLIGENVRLGLHLTRGIGAIKADPAQITQILTNLVINARDAMPHGGRLTIETQDVVLDHHYAGTHFAVVPGRYVQLAVTDTGEGMSPEVQRRIFEPFFTTKEVGRGTGMGLATVHGIVKQNRGNIWVYSEPGRGTTFKIYLPRVDAAADRAVAQSPGELAEGNTGTILVVEDHPSLLALTVRVLRSAGFDVLTADSPAAALDVARAYDGPIHLLLSDVVMPGQSGPWLAVQLQQTRPSLRVILMSGYTDDAVVRHGLVERTLTFLQKPFTPTVLIRKVRDVLSARDASPARDPTSLASADDGP